MIEPNFGSLANSEVRRTCTPADPKGRSDCADKLLGPGLWRWFGFFVSDAKETISHSYIKLAWPRNLQAELMKLSAARHFVKRCFIWPVSNQVVALLIVNDALDACIQVVIVAKGQSAGLLGQIIQTTLATQKSLLDDYLSFCST